MNLKQALANAYANLGAAENARDSAVLACLMSNTPQNQQAVANALAAVAQARMMYQSAYNAWASAPVPM